MTEQEENQINPIFRPRFIIDYNKGIIGIDHQNWILTVIRKYMKVYQKIFFYLSDMELFN